MSIKECCELMLKEGRVISFNDGVKLFDKNGIESNSVRNNRGRLYWRLRIDGKDRSLPIQNLVWLAHGNKFEEGKTLDHVDRNPLNNSICNLRMATPSEQSMNRFCVVPEEKRRKILKEIESGEQTIRGASRKYGIDRRHLSRMVRGDLKIQKDGLSYMIPKEKQNEISNRFKSTTIDLRNQIRQWFNSGEKTIRGMARELGLRREILQDMVRGRTYKNELKGAF